MNRRALRGSSSIAVVTDEQGNVVERLSYDAWGKRRFANGADDPAGSITSLTTKGFTGHEEIDAVGLVNMGGRIYDPGIGRFMSADPFIQDPFSPQDLNRYTYADNNPLSHTDPTGYKKHGFLRTLLSIFIAFIIAVVILPLAELSLGVNGVAASTTAFAGVEVSSTPLLMLNAGLAGGTANVVATGKAKSFLIGFAEGAAFAGIGHGLGIETNTFAGRVEAAALKGVVGGLVSVAQGGKFGSGFLAAGLSSLAGPNDFGNFALNTIEHAVLGGLGSVLGGGKFQDGAITGSFAYILNEGLKDERGKGPNERHKLGVAVAIDYARAHGFTIVSEGPVKVSVPGFSGTRDYDYLVQDPTTGEYFGEEVKTTLYSTIRLNWRQVQMDVAVVRFGGTALKLGLQVTNVGYQTMCFACSAVDMRSFVLRDQLAAAGIKTIELHYPQGGI